MAAIYTTESLEAMNYRELQACCKANGERAAGKTDELRARLAALLAPAYLLDPVSTPLGESTKANASPTPGAAAEPRPKVAPNTAEMQCNDAAEDEAVLESAGPSDSESTAQQDCNELRPEVQVDLNESQMAAAAEIEAQVEEAVQAAEAREVAEEAEMEAAVAMDTLLARVEADSLALSAPDATTTLQISPAEELTSLEEADSEVTPEPRELSGVDAGVTRSHTTWDANGNEITTTEVVVAAVTKKVINTPSKAPGADETWPQETLETVAAGWTPVKTLEEVDTENCVEEDVPMDSEEHEEEITPEPRPGGEKKVMTPVAKPGTDETWRPSDHHYTRPPNYYAENMSAAGTTFAGVHTHFGSSDEEDEAQAVSAAWTPLKTLEEARAHDASAVDDIAGALEGCKVAEDL